MNSKTSDNGIMDARVLGTPKMLTLGLQHTFAMFGATVLVPMITGLPIPATLLFAGIGTLIFHWISKFKVPAFLGSSFAFLGGYASIRSLGMEQYGLTGTLALDYACIGIFCAGLIYFVVAGFIKAFGVKRVLRFFPPVVTGPIIISIGLTLSGSAITSCTQNWGIALLAIAVVVICNIWGRGMVKILPILIGVIVAYFVSACLGMVDWTWVGQVPWVGFPIRREMTVLAVFDDVNWGLVITSILTIAPIALATMVEHIGDMCAISSTVGKNFLEDPGLHRTLIGDGTATALAALFGAPANTTYGENTGVLNITRVFDPRVVRIAACFAILLSFSPKFAAVIRVMPAPVIGGISLILYGMISAVGVRNIVEAKVDFTKPRNVIIAAMILVLAIGIKYGANDSVSLGSKFSLSGLAIAALTGIILNAVLPDADSADGTALKKDEKND